MEANTVISKNFRNWIYIFLIVIAITTVWLFTDIGPGLSLCKGGNYDDIS